MMSEQQEIVLNECPHGDKALPSCPWCIVRRQGDELIALRARCGLLEADIRGMRSVLGARDGEVNLSVAARVACSTQAQKDGGK